MKMRKLAVVSGCALLWFIQLSTARIITIPSSEANNLVTAYAIAADGDIIELNGEYCFDVATIDFDKSLTIQSIPGTDAATVVVNIAQGRDYGIMLLKPITLFRINFIVIGEGVGIKAGGDGQRINSCRFYTYATTLPAVEIDQPFQDDDFFFAMNYCIFQGVASDAPIVDFKAYTYCYSLKGNLFKDRYLNVWNKAFFIDIEKNYFYDISTYCALYITENGDGGGYGYVQNCDFYNVARGIVLGFVNGAFSDNNKFTKCSVAAHWDYRIDIGDHNYYRSCTAR
ncbi:MAG: hypothetical protein JW795_05495 [Chitinivibrionales bacterium]|nr:hypothetical protein [Chitinivibrionales bacterium]